LGSTQCIEVIGTDLLLTGCKNGSVWVTNKTNLGHYSVNDSGLVQKISGFGTDPDDPGIFSLVVWESINGPIFYVMPTIDVLKMFLYNSTEQRFPSIPTAQSLVKANFSKGGHLSVSSNGYQDGILWAMFYIDEPFGELYAFDANNVTTVLWRSEKNPKDSFGTLAKFNRARVINGYVYVPTLSGQIAVYGMEKVDSTSTDYQSVIIGVSIGGGCLILLIVGWLLYKRKKDRTHTPLLDPTRKVDMELSE